MLRWNVIVKKAKSLYHSERGMGEQERRDGMEQLLKETESVTILGLAIMKEGIEPVQYIKELLRRVGVRTKVVLAGELEDVDALTFGVTSFLYKTYADSILAHALPFVYGP